MTLPSLKPDHRTLTSATADVLRQAIRQGKFEAGSQLPPELELIEMLGVSRATLREALRTLEEQGFIVRRRGLGTYVRPQSIVKDLSINFGISDMINQAGLTPGVRDTVIYNGEADGVVAEALGVEEGKKIIRVERIRTANDRPVVWSVDIIRADLLGDYRLTVEVLDNHSLYTLLAERFQIRIARGAAQLFPIVASGEMAQKLGIAKGSPLLRVTQTDYDGDDRPVLHSIETHLPDAFVFLVNRKGPHW
jgi:GntR family transcriptional regulator